jgi:hydroxyethylthiazole kinase-like uncharacterized protein yjeF
MKALTAAEMREVDRLTAARSGIPSLQLMESAGRQVADAVQREFAPGLPSRIIVLCGRGNNGGDGLVAARYLKLSGIRPRVYLFCRPEEMRGDAAENLRRLQQAGDSLESIGDTAAWEGAWPEVAGADVIVDALLGTGLRGAAEGMIAKAIVDVNRLSGNASAPSPRLIVAVDTPSGLPSDGQRAEGPVLCAHLTVTFTAPKAGQLVSKDCGAVGSLQVREIGSPVALVEEIGQGSIRWVEPGEFAGLPLVRAADSHKGSFGHVLLFAGSLGKSGAAVLAGRGALRAGAGLVTVATPDVAQSVVAAGQPEYMTEALRATEMGTLSLASLEYGRFKQLEEGKSVIGIGPGLGTHPETQQLVRTVVRETRLPVILDADGLNAFAGHGDELRGSDVRPLAITPHPGEMARLLGAARQAVQDERLQTAQQAARRWNACVVLKGFHTLITGPAGSVFVSTSGNAGLAKGGSGDTLTGVLAALTAQFGTVDWPRVLALGVYLHGMAAERASRGADLSGLLASDVSDALPAARLELLRELQSRGS